MPEMTQRPLQSAPAVPLPPRRLGGVPHAVRPDLDHGGAEEQPECRWLRREPSPCSQPPRFPDIALPLPARVQRGGRAPGMAGPGATPDVLVPPCPVHRRLPQ